MTPEQSESEALMRRVVSGELPEDAPQVLIAVQRDPFFLDRLDALRRLQRDLDARAMRDQILSEASGSSWAEGEERLLATVASHAYSSPGGVADGEQGATPHESTPSPGEEGVEDSDDERREAGAPPWRTVIVVVAAAAALLILPFVDWAGDAPESVPQQPVFLGEELRGASPAGEVTSYARFEWDLELPPGWTFELRVYDDTPGSELNLLAAPPPLLESSWNAPAVERDWPSAIRWTLAQVSRNSAGPEPYVVRAWRSSP
ncbi:hypothetical protein [Engelhardtia mirabilis]|uniref:Anti-sigma-K factor rskA n=1 Tax=Engelhardtia mirabilis TaxID=2528011 RepID=A0A518BNT8_9BACT|nr:hypothetical protein Pla133_37410 [Planctomycetes bacterium Pla133]QDV02966.1 hypothetical protein Pla86_37400 [Planctomycetes bacterium Pla86]